MTQLKRFLQYLFIQKSLDRPFYRIILWWEFRRILYNLFLVLFSFISIWIMVSIPGEGYLKLYAGLGTSIFLISTAVLYFFFANLFYTLGWIFQLIINDLNLKFLEYHSRRWFLYGSIFSFLVTLLPIILVILNIILPEELLDICYRFFLEILNYLLQL